MNERHAMLVARVLHSFFLQVVKEIIIFIGSKSIARNNREKKFR